MNGAELVAEFVQAIRTIEPGAPLRGSSEAEVLAAETALGAPLPSVYRAYLLALGHDSGPFLRGSDVARPGEFAEFLADANELLQECATTFRLPAQAVVIALHQGYTFLYIIAQGGFDGPVYQFTEGEVHSAMTHASFEAFVRAELSLMQQGRGKNNV
jgi:hypothetical protein